jgi:hypothetical protein
MEGRTVLNPFRVLVRHLSFKLCWRRCTKPLPRSSVYHNFTLPCHGGEQAPSF